MKIFFLILSLFLGAPLSWAASPSNPSYLNFYTNEFTTNNPAPGRIRLKLDPTQFNIYSSNITIIHPPDPLHVTNIYVTNIYSSNIFVTNLYSTNIFATNIYTTNLYATNIYVTNLFATNIEANVTYTTNLYVTNLFVTYEVVSNIVAGNVHGTVGTLAMFTPDEFSVGDSIVTQNTNDNNGITINGTGEGYIVFGPGTTNTLARHDTDLIYESPKAGTRVGYFGVSNTVELAEALFGVAGNLAEVRGPSGASLLDSLTGGNEIRWGFNQFFPRQTNTILGSIGLTPRFELAAIHAFTNVVHGFYDATDTNYSRLAVTHTGTNGAVVFDSQSSGTAGDPRDFDFKTNGTNRYALVAALPGTFDGLRVYGQGATNYVRYGATDNGADAHISAGVNGAVWLNPSLGAAGNFGAFGNSFAPDTAGASLGTGINPWAILQLGGGYTKAQKALLTPVDGMIIYQTDNTPGLRVYVAGTWYMIPTVADP